MSDLRRTDPRCRLLTYSFVQQPFVAMASNPLNEGGVNYLKISDVSCVRCFPVSHFEHSDLQTCFCRTRLLSECTYVAKPGGR